MSMPDPVGVSGPGALSQRVDKQPLAAPTGMPYGAHQDLITQEQGAPMAAAPPPPPPPPLTAPTTRPNEPVTHGADAGPGADSSILTNRPGPPATGGALSQMIARAAAADTSGTLQQLLIQAQQRGL